ncbi:MAG TPA: hypothetical protein VIH45_01430 [Desulfuromonadaceae bacterium]
MPKNAKAIMGIVLVFLLGAASGALVTHMIHRIHMERFISGGPAAREELIIRRLNHRLDLDSSQLEQVRGIVHETHTAMGEIRSQTRPRIEALLEQGETRINAILRPDQREKFANIVAERKTHRRGGPSPGQP